MAARLGYLRPMASQAALMKISLARLELQTIPSQGIDIADIWRRLRRLLVAGLLRGLERPSKKPKADFLGLPQLLRRRYDEARTAERGIRAHRCRLSRHQAADTAQNRRASRAEERK